MKLFQSIILSAMSLFVMLLSLPFSTQADSSLSRRRHLTNSKPTASPAPYRLTLSIADNTHGLSSDIPNVTLNLINSTPHTLILLWTPPYPVIFEVDYKAATDDPHLATGWKRLTPYPHLSPSAGPQVTPGTKGAIVIMKNHVERIVILPKQERGFSFSPDFPMSTQGFYRIKAMMAVPDAREFDESVSPATLIRSFKLVVRSKPFVVCHNADGFVPIDATTKKLGRLDRAASYFALTGISRANLETRTWAGISMGYLPSKQARQNLSLWMPMALATPFRLR